MTTSNRTNHNNKYRTKQSGVGVKTLHRFYYLILQTPPAKSASDFAAIELANKM